MPLQLKCSCLSDIILKLQREALEAVSRQKARLHDQEIKDIKALATDQSLPNRQPNRIYDSSDKLNVVLKGECTFKKAFDTVDHQITLHSHYFICFGAA